MSCHLSKDAGSNGHLKIITSFVREFRGPDAHIECSMVDEAGKVVSRCLMIVAYVDKITNRAKDWPIDTMTLFVEK